MHRIDSDYKQLDACRAGLVVELHHHHDFNCVTGAAGPIRANTGGPALASRCVSHGPPGLGEVAAVK